MNSLLQGVVVQKFKDLLLCHRAYRVSMLLVAHGDLLGQELRLPRPPFNFIRKV